MLEAGIKGEQSVGVVYENTATAVGSGVLEVFGTPCMLALIGKNSKRERSSLSGRRLRQCWYTGNDQPCSGNSDWNDCSLRDRAYRSRRTRLVFKVAAYDEAGLIGEGTHERFIVQNEKFQTKDKQQTYKITEIAKSRTPSVHD